MSGAERLARAREQLAAETDTSRVDPEPAVFITPQRARLLRGIIQHERAETAHDSELAECLRDTSPPAPPDASRPAAAPHRPMSVCVGGPRHGWVYFTADLELAARADERMGRAPSYERTETYQAETGHRRWTWLPTPPAPSSAGSFDPDAAYWHSPHGLSQYSSRRARRVGGRR